MQPRWPGSDASWPIGANAMCYRCGFTIWAKGCGPNRTQVAAVAEPDHVSVPQDEERCGICCKTYEECDCARTGRR
ncbi:MAG: hypothetical protein WAT39_00025 [Planctomycetota bacterium]